nr:sensor domain-containing diguanylate cyclase [Dissulfurirhabdus thermomarina]
MDRERGITERLCAGLRELNGALGAEAVLDAALKSAKVLVQADFAAVCLVEPDGGYRVARAVGPGAEGIEGRAFAAREGLVGQALRINRSLPVGGVRRGRAPVFGDRHGLPGYPSLRVIPLRHDDDAPVGALAVAARRPGAFHRVRREILELIAAQMAVKIDQARAHEEIRRMATSDGLTGLANHRTFQHAFDMMLARAGRRGGKMALILCDIDHFKRVNDTYGHPFGDRVLREVAGVLRGAVRKVDLAARYGGEEFAVLLEDADLGGARRLAERIRTGVARLRFPLEGREVRVSISLGIAVFPEDGHDKGVLVERADQALYQAKAGGRNRAVAWDDLRIPNPGAAPG